MLNNIKTFDNKRYKLNIIQYILECLGTVGLVGLGEAGSGSRGQWVRVSGSGAKVDPFRDVRRFWAWLSAAVAAIVIDCWRWD